jgi:prevent-host-death family protein
MACGIRRLIRALNGSLQEIGPIFNNQIVAEAVKISATEAARNFSGLINRVHYRGETFVVERGGEPVGKIVPLRRLALLALNFSGCFHVYRIRIPDSLSY